MSVVITGTGMLTPLGTRISEVFPRLLEAPNTISEIEGFDTSALSVRFASQIKDFDPHEYIPDKKKVRQSARFILYGCAALHEALKEADLLEHNLDPGRIGIVMGSGMGGIDVFEENVIKGYERGPRRHSPFFIPMSITNMQPGFMAIEHNFQGPNFSISTACATGNHCIIEGAEIIRRGEADVVVVGGSEFPINMSGMGGFAALKALSTWNDDPEHASRPFDQLRHGFVVGEGAGVLILESEAHAKARGIDPLARYLGGGSNCDAFHITAPNPEGTGAAAAMELALKNASIQPDEISYVNAHGTSTQQGDLAESRALCRVFGESGQKLIVNSTKSILGHSLGAAGAIEAVVLIESLRRGLVHPNRNLERPDNEIKIPLVGKSPHEIQGKIGMSNAFGFGGHNSCVLFEAL